MRVAIVGLGNRAIKVLSFMRNAMPEIEFVGFVDPSENCVGEIADSGLIKRYLNLEEMLTSTDVDLLFVGSPNHVHMEHIETGLKNGVRIFAEKPIVTSFEQTWRMAELIKHYGHEQIIVGLVLRYSNHIIDLRNAIDNDQLGEIVSLEANEHIMPSHGAFFMRDWRRNSEFSGGFMLEKCCHDLDLYNYITGSRPIKVASFGGRKTFVEQNAPEDSSEDDVYHLKKSSWNHIDDPFAGEGDIIDHQTVLMKFENDVSMTFHSNLNTPDEHRRFCIIGTKGMAEGDFQRGYLKITDSKTGKLLLDKNYNDNAANQTDHYGTDVRMAQDITSFLRKKINHLPVNTADALEAGIVALAIDVARKTEEMVDLTPYWEKFDSYNLKSSI